MSKSSVYPVFWYLVLPVTTHWAEGMTVQTSVADGLYLTVVKSAWSLVVPGMSSAGFQVSPKNCESHGCDQTTTGSKFVLLKRLLPTHMFRWWVSFP